MSLEEIADALRRRDPDRFGASLIAPPEARVRLWVLYAFNHEVARAPLQTGEPLVAEMRLQWWIDQLDAVAAGHLPAHDLLIRIASTWGAEAGALAPLAEARRRDCDRRPFADADEVEAYVRATAVPLMQLAVRALDGAPAAAQPVIESQALGAGLAGWLSALPELDGFGLGLQRQDAATVAELARRGRAALEEARAGRRHVPRRLAPALFRGPHLRRLLAGIGAGGDIARQATPSEFRRRLALSRLALTGRWWD